MKGRWEEAIEPYYEKDSITIYCADCLDVMRSMPDNFIDTILTDPPYGLEFMGKEWDKLDSAVIKYESQWWKGEYQGTGFKMLPQPTGSKNYKCKKCGHYKHSGTPCTCENPEWEPSAINKQRLMQLWHQQWATEALRIAKPGAILMAFGGTRTHHRLMCGLEDAEWEIRDTLMWAYGSGFPKSHDISKAIDKTKGAKREIIGKAMRVYPDNPKSGSDSNALTGLGLPGTAHIRPIANITAPTTPEARLWGGWGTALKPAWEPIILAMKPLDGTFAQNALKWGVAGLWIDGGRIPGGMDDTQESWNKKGAGGEAGGHGYAGQFSQAMKRAYAEGKIALPQGRWPANVILNEEAAAMLDEQSGELSASNPKSRNRKSTIGGNGIYSGGIGMPTMEHADLGGASRFFYCAKASRSERGEGNKHPTVKPLKLMEYLCKLTMTPSGGVVLEPFGGSGTTALACKRLGRKCIMVEKSEEDCETAVKRLEKETPIQRSFLRWI